MHLQRTQTRTKYEIYFFSFGRILTKPNRIIETILRTNKINREKEGGGGYRWTSQIVRQTTPENKVANANKRLLAIVDGQ